MVGSRPTDTIFEMYIAVIIDRPLLRLLLAIIDSGVNAPCLDSYLVVLLACIFLIYRIKFFQ